MGTLATFSYGCFMMDWVSLPPTHKQHPGYQNLNGSVIKHYDYHWYQMRLRCWTPHIFLTPSKTL